MTMKPEAWQAVIDINLSGVFYASKAAASVMLRARRGRIINMASVVGQIGNPGQVSTCYVYRPRGFQACLFLSTPTHVSRFLSLFACDPILTIESFIMKAVTQSIPPLVLYIL